MRKIETKTAIQSAAEQLRSIVLDSDEGAMIGSEDVLIAQLRCSRSTVRQVARLLEREGLLRVKRGINGGYFGSRPDVGTIEATVSAYLETLDMDLNDITILASALWIEAVRKAALADPKQTEILVEKMRPRIAAIPDTAAFETVRSLALDIQAEIFQLANSDYIKLLFDINVAFSRRQYIKPNEDDDSAEHWAFVRDWRNAKLMELDAIRSGNAQLAAMAGQHSRHIWHARVERRFANSAAL